MMFLQTLMLLPLLGSTALAAVALDERATPCGFKIAACPTGQYCKPVDPSCTRGQNCLGTCKKGTAPTTTTTTTTTATPTPTPTPTKYKSCGGFRVDPASYKCTVDEICMDDPYSGGCGMACDAPGICVKPVFCGGFAGIQCKDKTKMCVDDPRDDCDPLNGGADCGGVCV
ncbi:hypothetical protein B0H66DRAFT_636535 [Apodospora peruviana]|uniref:Uncharacterized protein n=1 Tax=Apodospora peruviana TaxID=516989 RepID=A0AAE0IH24_9PEZI|nr:hypothetical protein B0H66DRAFT_636535 [Apodospora peruviana]